MSTRPSYNLIRLNGVGATVTRTNMFSGPDKEFSVVMEEPLERDGRASGNVEQIDNLTFRLNWKCPAAATLYAAGIGINKIRRLQFDE